MTLLDVIILSIVEGITEFLPVSSTGHLILTSELLTLQHTEFLKSFEIYIQLGAIMAVVVLYWKRFFQDKSVWWRVGAAFLPTAFIGLVLYKFIKGYLLGNELITLSALFIGGIVLILLELFFKKKEHTISSVSDVSLKKAAIIGVFQGLSIIPGVSRSASTIIGGLFVGMKRDVSVEFSFLLAVPTMLAASGLDVIETGFAFSTQELLLLSVGFISSFIVALIVIKLFVKFVQKHTFIPFGIYRIVLAVLYWIFIIR